MLIKVQMGGNIFLYLLIMVACVAGCSANIEKSNYPFDSTSISDFNSPNFYQNLSNLIKTSSVDNLKKKKTSTEGAELDSIIIESWQFHRYMPTDSNFLGLWPSLYRKNNVSKLREMNIKWGFSHILLQTHFEDIEYNKFREAGFDESKILVHINSKYQNPPDYRIMKYKNAYGFYIDEPYSVSPNYTLNEFEKISNFIKKLNNPILIIGDLKPSDCLDEFVKYNDKVMFSAYHRTYQLLGCLFRHWPLNIDQRGSWDVMKKRYGEKFSSTWIAAHQDTLEYFQLMKHAAELKLESVWLYQLQDTTDEYSDQNVAMFAEAAWQNGYLKKITQKVRYTLKCIDTKNPNKNDSWIIQNFVKLDTFKEEIP